LKLSVQGRIILQALTVHGQSGRLHIKQLVRLVGPRGRTPAVRQASLSRTLRRLWRAGLVELISDWQETMTGKQQRNQTRLAEIEANPEAAYARHQDLLQEDAAPSLEAYLMGVRTRMQHPPDMRVQRVQITPKGRMIARNG
jgi:hypothetical protein